MVAYRGRLVIYTFYYISTPTASDVSGVRIGESALFHYTSL